ncbi:hypothetical protein Aduo_015456 [Ancylostoma duodenale]
MIVWLLLSVTEAYGASIPPQPVIPTASACLQGCFESGSVVNAAFDLFNFKSIGVDIENFCRYGRRCRVSLPFPYLATAARCLRAAVAALLR